MGSNSNSFWCVRFFHVMLKFNLFLLLWVCCVMLDVLCYVGCVVLCWMCCVMLDVLCYVGCVVLCWMCCVMLDVLCCVVLCYVIFFSLDHHFCSKIIVFQDSKLDTRHTRTRSPIFGRYRVHSATHRGSLHCYCSRSTIRETIRKNVSYMQMRFQWNPNEMLMMCKWNYWNVTEMLMKCE